jgi:hypothetical protein
VCRRDRAHLGPTVFGDVYNDVNTRHKVCGGCPASIPVVELDRRGVVVLHCIEIS